MGTYRPHNAEGEVGPDEGLAGLFMALEGSLLNYALRLLKDSEMSQDIVQEAFLKLQAQGPAVREPRSWLYRTIHNLALNHLRTTHRLVSLNGSSVTRSEGEPVEEAVDLQPLPDEQLARWEQIGLVRLGLQNLDERSRELLRLKFHEDLSYKEMASRTGLTIGHVGYLLHHALKSLAADLAQAGFLS